MPNGDFITSPWAEVDTADPQKSLAGLPNEKKLILAKEALEGKCFPKGKDQFGNLFHHWLLWMHRNHSAALRWWHWLNEQPKAECLLTLSKRGKGKRKPETVDLRDRDGYTIRLWHSMNDDGAANQLAKEQVKQKRTTWSYYERHFFNWFLERFNVVDARQVFNKGWFNRYVHLPLSLVATVLVLWYFGFSSQSPCEWLLAMSGIIFAFILGNVLAWIKPAYYLQSLIPRLAVTTGIGYLFLFSASGLTTVIYSNKIPLEGQRAISLTLIIVVLIYMMQVIQRAVQPRLKFWPAFVRSLHLIVMAIAYSAVGLLICAPVLYNSLFLGSETYNNPGHPAGYLLITAAIALAIGVALQLVWEDKPVTEPL